MTDPALGHPFCHHPYAQKLSKDLRDLRRRNEISFLAKLVSAMGAGGVITAIWRGEALTHIRCYRDWAGGLDKKLVHCSKALQIDFTAIASAMFLARGVDQSRVEDDENLRLEDIPRYKVPFPKRPELVGSLVHALDIISPSKYSSGRIGAAVRIKPKVTSQKDNDLMWSGLRG